MKKPDVEYAGAARILRALAHPARIQLLQRLLENECCVSEVKNCLGLSQPNVSQHLKVLKKAGLIAGTRRKTQICYRIADERIHHIFKILSEGERKHE